MEIRVIYLEGDTYSERVAERCINSGKRWGHDVIPFKGVKGKYAREIMQNHGLQWGWANFNTEKLICPHTGIQHFPYNCKNLDNKIGCSMSHYLLWVECYNTKKDILILEHDAVFIKELPPIYFQGICQINDPAGCTPKGGAWSYGMRKRGPGIWNKTKIDYPDNRPDGLAGNSAYMIKPHAALALIAAFNNYGVWPNDATICIQLFDYLEELYPFVVETRQERSTTVL